MESFLPGASLRRASSAKSSGNDAARSSTNRPSLSRLGAFGDARDGAGRVVWDASGGAAADEEGEEDTDTDPGEAGAEVEAEAEEDEAEGKETGVGKEDGTVDVGDNDAFTDAGDTGDAGERVRVCTAVEDAASPLRVAGHHLWTWRGGRRLMRRLEERQAQRLRQMMSILLASREAEDKEGEEATVEGEKKGGVAGDSPEIPTVASSSHSLRWYSAANAAPQSSGVIIEYQTAFTGRLHTPRVVRAGNEEAESGG